MKFGKLFSTIEGLLLVHEFNHEVHSIREKYEKHAMALFKDPSYISGFYLKSPSVLEKLHLAGLDKEIVEYMIDDANFRNCGRLESAYKDELYNAIHDSSKGIAVPKYMPIGAESYKYNLKLIDSINKEIEEDGKTKV